LGKKDLCHHTTRLQCEDLEQGWNTTKFHVVGVLEVTPAFAFAFVPLEEGEEGFLAVRRDGFF
jgi:hypothetical protein